MKNDYSIIIDVTEKIEGQTNVNRAMLTVLLHILIELRIANGRTGDHGDKNVMSGAQSAMKSLRSML